MFRILYRSAAAKSFTQEDLSELLERARDNNRAANVTGMLVYAGRDFLQVLEGEPADVIRIFEAINVDPRHSQIEVLQRGTVYGKRAFAGWSMGFTRIDMSTGKIGAVAINDRIRLWQMDAMTSLDFLKASAASQSR